MRVLRVPLIKYLYVGKCNSLYIFIFHTPQKPKKSLISTSVCLLLAHMYVLLFALHRKMIGPSFMKLCTKLEHPHYWWVGSQFLAVGTAVGTDIGSRSQIWVLLLMSVIFYFDAESIFWGVLGTELRNRQEQILPLRPFERVFNSLLG